MALAAREKRQEPLPWLQLLPPPFSERPHIAPRSVWREAARARDWTRRGRTVGAGSCSGSFAVHDILRRALDARLAALGIQSGHEGKIMAEDNEPLES